MTAKELLDKYTCPVCGKHLKMKLIIWPTECVCRLYCGRNPFKRHIKIERKDRHFLNAVSKAMNDLYLLYIS